MNQWREASDECAYNCGETPEQAELRFQQLVASFREFKYPPPDDATRAKFAKRLPRDAEIPEGKLF